MTDDLIRRQDAIDEIRKSIIPHDIACASYSNLCINAVRRVSSADRPQGEWIDRGWKGDWQFETDGRGNCWKVFECSACDGENTIKTRFCPNCGARMKGGEQ